MANNQNLKPFTSENQPAKRGRPKGSLNRATIVRKWLETQVNIVNPITGIEELLSEEEIITLALIKKAIKGDTRAYKALMDSAYGAPVRSLDLNADITVEYFAEYVE